MSFAHASASDGLPFFLIGVYLTGLAFRPVPKRIAEDPLKLRRYKSLKEVYTFAGPGLAIVSAMFILAKLTI
jgi:hypothetical protein